MSATTSSSRCLEPPVKRSMAMADQHRPRGQPAHPRSVRWRPARHRRRDVASANSPVSMSASASSEAARAGQARPRAAAPPPRRSSVAAAGMSPRAKARRPAAAELGRGPPRELAARVVEWPELGPVAERLLEVEAEDLLELLLAAALPVDPLGPRHEALVELGAGPLEQRAVRRLADQPVAKAVRLLVGIGSGRGRRTACRRASLRLAGHRRPDRARRPSPRPPARRTSRR